MIDVGSAYFGMVADRDAKLKSVVAKLNALTRQSEDYISRPASAAVEAIEQLQSALSSARAECERLRAEIAELRKPPKWIDPDTLW